MKKRTLLSRRKAVKCLTILAVMFAAAIPATAREAKAAAGTTFKVKVSDGYLALRSEKAFDKSNEIGQLNTGDLVEVTDRKDPTYWYAYVPRLDRSGYLDKNYIQVAESTAASNDSWTVKVKSGYLALRNTAAYNDSNEIGRLNTGDMVLVKDSSDSTYWYVYVPKLDKSGYVDNRYIYNSGLWTVKIEKGYLALRNQAAYNDSNEIGQLNTGDTVQVKDTADEHYWYVYVPKLDKTGYVDKEYLLGGAGTTIGGLIGVNLKSNSNKFFGFILSFASGLMMAIICFDLLPEAMEIASLAVILLGILLGIFTMIICDTRVKEKFSNKKGMNSLLRTGIIISIGLALHNIPEGLAIGTGFQASINLGLSLAIVIAIHDVPEGIFQSRHYCKYVR